MGEWIKLEEAPRLGEKVLAVDKIGDIEVCYTTQDYCGGELYYYTYQTRLPFLPTHWMPLPEAPNV